VSSLVDEDLVSVRGAGYDEISSNELITECLLVYETQTLLHSPNNDNLMIKVIPPRQIIAMQCLSLLSWEQGVDCLRIKRQQRLVDRMIRSSLQDDAMHLVNGAG
jgi:hypothetical protein